MYTKCGIKDGLHDNCGGGGYAECTVRVPGPDSVCCNTDITKQGSRASQVARLDVSATDGIDSETRSADKWHPWMDSR